MDWQEVRITINQMAADALANIMEELGAQGVIFSEKGERVELTAYYPDLEDFSQLINTLKERAIGLVDFGLNTGEVDFAIRLTSDEDWSTSWHKFFKPLKLGEKFLVCPTWEKCENKTRKIIEMDPGMAFGVGSHETTRMCAEILEKYVNNHQGKLLDIGTGTGILAIVAAKLGMKEVLGIDIDPIAVKVAQENVEKNMVKEQVQIKKGNLLQDIKGTYTIIVANIIPNVLLELIPKISPFMNKDGILILSGIIDAKKLDILESLRDNRLVLKEELQKGEWISFVVEKG